MPPSAARERAAEPPVADATAVIKDAIGLQNIRILPELKGRHGLTYNDQCQRDKLARTLRQSLRSLDNLIAASAPDLFIPGHRSATIPDDHWYFGFPPFNTASLPSR